MGGGVTPDTLTLDKTGQVIKRDTAEKLVQTLRVNGGTEEGPVPESLRGVPVLSDEQAAELGQLGQRIEEPWIFRRNASPTHDLWWSAATFDPAQVNVRTWTSGELNYFANSPAQEGSSPRPPTIRFVRVIAERIMSKIDGNDVEVTLESRSRGLGETWWFLRLVGEGIRGDIGVKGDRPGTCLLDDAVSILDLRIHIGKGMESSLDKDGIVIPKGREFHCLLDTQNDKRAGQIVNFETSTEFLIAKGSPLTLTEREPEATE